MSKKVERQNNTAPRPKTAGLWRRHGFARLGRAWAFVAAQVNCRNRIEITRASNYLGIAKRWRLQRLGVQPLRLCSFGAAINKVARQISFGVRHPCQINEPLIAGLRENRLHAGGLGGWKDIARRNLDRLRPLALYFGDLLAIRREHSGDGRNAIAVLLVPIELCVGNAPVTSRPCGHQQPLIGGGLCSHLAALDAIGGESRAIDGGLAKRRPAKHNCSLGLLGPEVRWRG